ncbi:MAG: hypothetical protein OEY80_12920, partial [Nitrospirota bacterium]|nr:hypothetical protein [Nitrospirota bacterium]
TKQLITFRKHHASLGIGMKGHQLRVWENPSKTVLTVYRKNPDKEAMLLILGFNDQPATLTISQPKGQWRLLLDNSQPEYTEPDDISSSAAPLTLDLASNKATLSLPAFPAWVYKQS